VTVIIAAEDVPRLKTMLGYLEGTYKVSEPSQRKFAAYQGIPYAVTPIDRLRFQPPLRDDLFYKPHEALKADKPGSDCPQLDFITGEYKGSEDCLYLNVFTPQLESVASSKYPVMVWIHGGAFQFGSGSSEQFGPERLLDEEVVLVTINYRLGPLGFLTTGDEEAPPNIGLLDQQMALRWVQDHIHAFGGDQDRVTIFGEDAGAISVMAHIASPYSENLFQQAIAMSGVWGEMPFLHKSQPAPTYANQLAAKLGCDTSLDTAAIADCLRHKKPKDLLTQAATFRIFNFLPEPFTPSVDDYMPYPILAKPLHQLWDDISSFSPVPLIIGGNKDEGILMLLEFLQDETKLTELNDNFATLGPALLLGVDPESNPWLRDESEAATATVLRDSYLGEDVEFSVSSQSDMISLLTDLHILAPLHKTVTQLVKTGKPTYYYNYQYNGSFSLPMAFGIWEKLGVCHMDELFLLFKFPEVSSSWLGDLALQTEEDKMVSRKLVTLWTNFAKNGSPTSDGSWKPVTSTDKIEYAVLDGGSVRMEYPEIETKRWMKIGEMLDLARTARALSKDEHPELEEMRQLRDELYKKAMEIEMNDGQDSNLAEENARDELYKKAMEIEMNDGQYINLAEDKVRDSREDEEGYVIEKTEELVDDEEGDVIEKTEIDAVDNRDIYGVDGDREEYGIEEPFDPVREMRKLMELEAEEGEAFREHIQSLGIDLEELGLEDPWQTQRSHHKDEL